MTRGTVWTLPLVLLALAGCLGASPESTERSSRRDSSALSSSFDPAGSSCQSSCGGRAPTCWCDALCEQYGDCCLDKAPICDQQCTPEASGQRAFVQQSNGGAGLWSEFVAVNTAAMTVLSDFGPRRVFRVTAPSLLGPGVELYELDPQTLRFHDVTRRMLPEEYGRHAIFSDVAWIDLNADGFKDFVLSRNKGSVSARAYLFDPKADRFVGVGINKDLNGTGGYAATYDEMDAFMQTKNLSYHARKIVVSDLDLDGDEDIFVARSTTNVIFENLTIDDGTYSRWDHRTAIGANGRPVQRFATHHLDRVVSGDPSATFAHSTANAIAVTFEDGGPGIIAADNVCYGRVCASNGDRRYVHVYRFNPRYDRNAACADGSNSALELSCKFIDVARIEIHSPQSPGANATSLLYVDVNQDSIRDVVVLGGPSTADEADEMANCFIDPNLAECASIDHAQMQNVVLVGRGGGRFAAPVPAPGHAFSRQGRGAFRLIDDAVTVDFDHDGIEEVVLYNPRTRFDPRQSLTIFDPGQNQIRGCAGLDFDHDVQGLTLYPFDLEGDGRTTELHLEANRIGRTYWPTRRGCLELRGTVPTESRDSSAASVFADFDGDGLTDMYLPVWTDSHGTGDEIAAILYMNHGGIFVESDALPRGTAYQGTTATAIDIDHDGDLDILTSRRGPMQLLLNELNNPNERRFIDASTALPSFYTADCEPRADQAACTQDNQCASYNCAANRCIPARCSGYRMAVSDFDGSGSEDVALVQRKGSNDILFNNFFQKQAHTPCKVTGAAGLCRKGFVSARHDLGIPKIFGTTDANGAGQNNRANFVLATCLGANATPTGPLSSSPWTPAADSCQGQKDIVVVSNPNPGHVGDVDKLFVNRISAPFPYAVACQANGDCASNRCDAGVCVGADGAVSPSGFFVEDAGAVPQRDSGAAGIYRSAACAALGDFDGDGYEDLLRVTQAAELQPNLQGESRLNTEAGVCGYRPTLDLTAERNQGFACLRDCTANLTSSGLASACAQSCIQEIEEAKRDDFVALAQCAAQHCSTMDDTCLTQQCHNLTYAVELNQRNTQCNVAYVCKPWRCDASNPEGRVPGGTGFGFETYPESDNRCCQPIPLNADGTFDQDTLPVFGAHMRGAAGGWEGCMSRSAASPDYCSMRGFREEPASRIAEAKIFVSRWDPIRGQFESVPTPVSMRDADFKDSIIKGCAIADLDHDGKNDFVVGGYNTGAMPEAARAAYPSDPPLLTGLWFGRRRIPSTQPTMVWLNPGWTPGVSAAPFTPGKFPRRSDKIYGVKAADLDGDCKQEIVTLGAAGPVTIFDDAP